jgi:hypothetical protein
MTLDSNQFFTWCVGVIVLVFAAGMIFVAVCTGVLPYVSPRLERNVAAAFGLPGRGALRSSF